jgi:large-conductance mechanosensitive channel
MSLLGDFRSFLNEYGIIALAVALIIGLAVTALVNAIVSDIVMPMVAIFLPGGG